MPRAQRSRPLHQQIADYYRGKMVSGEPGFRPGDKLPSVRAVATEWAVGQQTAQQGLGLLKTGGMVRTDATGTYVLGKRDKAGPQQRARAATFPGTERTEIRAAEIITAPEYVVPILGLEPAADGQTRVLRREWITYEDGSVPFMLSVSWCSPDAAALAPELLDLLPLPGSGSVARLVCARQGWQLTGGSSSREARKVRDDGREAPLLRLAKADCVLAEVYVWWSGEHVVEYGEFALAQNRVIQTDMEP